MPITKDDYVYETLDLCDKCLTDLLLKTVQHIKE